MARAGWVFLLVALVTGGCLGAPSAPGKDAVWVGPPADGGGFAPCASHAAQEIAIPGLGAREIADDQGRGVGIHRLDAGTILYVWAAYHDTLRQDDVPRLNRVEVHREPDGSHVVCTRVEIVAPLFVDGERRSYAVGAVITAPGGFPDGDLRVVVNWVAGCSPCDPAPRGNATTVFRS